MNKMQFVRLIAFFVLFFRAASAQAEPVAATVEATLPTEAGHIRQFAFDGNSDTYFASARKLQKSDSFTLAFEKPVELESVRVTTGTAKGEELLNDAALEVSHDGKEFKEIVNFKGGIAAARLKDCKISALRVRPLKDLNYPLVIREFAIQSNPPVEIFRYPIEFIVDVADAPDLKNWADNTAKVCERQYFMINEELKSAGFKPPTTISFTLKNDYDGVAKANSNRIIGSVKFFKEHPEDVGAIVHETVHCVQSYRTPNNPRWLIEGVADYVRFFKYEEDRFPPLKPDRLRYDGGYRATAKFLAYVAEKYNKELVRKLNQAMRDGEYKEELWKTLTRKSLQDLGDEWKASLKK